MLSATLWRDPAGVSHSAMMHSACGTPTRSGVLPIRPSQMISSRSNPGLSVPIDVGSARGFRGGHCPNLQEPTSYPARRSEELIPIATALTGGTALAGPHLDPVDDAIVVIEGDRDRRRRARCRGRDPGGAEVVDLPRLNHRSRIHRRPRSHRFRRPADVLAGGVTTVRDLGWPPGRDPSAGRALPTADFDGPEVVPAGPMLTAPVAIRRGRRGLRAGRHARSMARATRASRRSLRTAEEGARDREGGAQPTGGPDASLRHAAAIVEAAAERELRVTGHIYGLDELHKALDAGMDELAHMLMSDEEIPDETIDRMVEPGMAVVPTLSMRFGHDRRGSDREPRTVPRGRGPSCTAPTSATKVRARASTARDRARCARRVTRRAEIVRAATIDAAGWLGLERPRFARGRQARRRRRPAGRAARRIDFT